MIPSFSDLETGYPPGEQTDVPLHDTYHEGNK